MALIALAAAFAGVSRHLDQHPRPPRRLPGPRPPRGPRRGDDRGADPGQHGDRPRGPPPPGAGRLRADARPLRPAPGAGPGGAPRLGAARRPTSAAASPRTAASSSCWRPGPASSSPPATAGPCARRSRGSTRPRRSPAWRPRGPSGTTAPATSPSSATRTGREAAQRRADQTPARTARDHYLLATSLRPPRRARRATTAPSPSSTRPCGSTRGITGRWSCAGSAHLEKGDYVSAAGDFGLCTGLWPDLAWGYFNRGYVLDRSGRKAEAVEDYTAAIERDPRFVPARINRGLALLELRRYAEALADFEPAAAARRRRRRRHALRRPGHGPGGPGPARGGRRGVRPGVRRPSGPPPARSGTRLLWTYGFAVSARLPAKAREAFEEVLRQDPRHPQALYGLAMLAMTEGRLDEAVALLRPGGRRPRPTSSRPAATAPSPWPAPPPGSRPAATSTGASSASRARARPCTPPRASPRSRPASSAPRRRSASRSTCSGRPSTGASASTSSPPTPTSKPSATSPSSDGSSDRHRADVARPTTP